MPKRSLDWYEGPTIKTSEDWLALEPKERRNFAEQMDVMGPIEALLDRRSVPLPEAIEKTCPYCLGKGVIKHSPRKTGVFSPSDITGCMRRQYFQLVGFKSRKAWDLTGNLTMDIGTAIHLLFQKDYLWELYGPESDDPVSFEEEVKVRIPEWDLLGSGDGVFTFEKFRFGLEIKSASAKTIEKLGDPEAKYLMQNVCYNRGLDLPGTLFLYVEKPWPHRTVQIFNGFDPEMWKSVEMRIAAVRKHVEDGTLPDKTVPDFDCRSCWMSHICKYGTGDL